MQMNTVAYDEGHKFDELETKLLLADAISDLPPVCKLHLLVSCKGLI